MGDGDMASAPWFGMRDGFTRLDRVGSTGFQQAAVRLDQLIAEFRGRLGFRGMERAFRNWERVGCG